MIRPREEAAMFAFSGKVISAQRLKTNYLSVVLRRERDGLLGPTVQVLVPTLVALRDGPPQIGMWTRVDAVPAQAADLAQGLSGFDFVASRLQSADDRARTDVLEEEAPAALVANGMPDKDALLP